MRNQFLLASSSWPSPLYLGLDSVLLIGWKVFQDDEAEMRRSGFTNLSLLIAIAHLSTCFKKMAAERSGLYSMFLAPPPSTFQDPLLHPLLKITLPGMCTIGGCTGCNTRRSKLCENHVTTLGAPKSNKLSRILLAHFWTHQPQPWCNSTACDIVYCSVISKKFYQQPPKAPIIVWQWNASTGDIILVRRITEWVHQEWSLWCACYTEALCPSPCPTLPRSMFLANEEADIHDLKPIRGAQDWGHWQRLLHSIARIRLFEILRWAKNIRYR